MSYNHSSYPVMTRGRGFSSRGGYRGGGGRGSWGGGYSESRYVDKYARYASDSFPSRSHPEEYKSYNRMENSYMGRESRRSPDRKRMRMEGPSSRHESSYNSGYGSSRHDLSSSYSERRGYSGERHSAPAPYRKEDYRSSGPSPRGSYRGRISSRGSRGLRARDRPIRRRLIESSYGIRKRTFPRSDFNRRLRLVKLRRAGRSTVFEGEKEEDDVKKETEAEEGKDGEVEETTGDGESPEKPHRDTLEEKVLKKTYVKLQCPHCNVKCLTFIKYDLHLMSRFHQNAMRRLSIKHSSILAQMRRAQRKSQNELEKDMSDDTETNFCELCRLNYKQKVSVHQLSESHKNMKKYVQPSCKICEVTFKTRMFYENHIAAIGHMKRKHRAELGSDAEPDENDLENFTTIDSVGDGTENVEAEPAASQTTKTEKKEVDIGIDQIRKIETHYCELCKMYLPRGKTEEMSKIITRHCKQNVHMRRYIRLKEREQIAKRAALLQKKENAEKTKKEGDNNPDANGEETTKEEGKEGEDDKLWADVDKDLGDILAEAESGNKSSDEDEDSHVNGERYDRFKLSEKNEEDKLMETDDTVLENNPEEEATAAK